MQTEYLSTNDTLSELDMNAVLADINALEGTNSDETPAPTTTPAIEEVVKPTEEEDDSTLETPSSEIKTEADIRKEVEKELRKKYLSQVNKKDKEAKQLRDELEGLKTSGYDEDSIEAVRKIVRAENAQFEMTKIEQTEKDSFVKKFNPVKTEMDAITEMKEDFPNMSWEAARKLYLAENNPDALIKPKSPNLGLGGDVPKSIVSGPDTSDEAVFMELVRKEAFASVGRSY